MCEDAWKSSWKDVHNPIMVQTVSFLPKSDLKCYTKCQVWHPLRTGNGTKHCKGRHALLLEYVMTFSRCIRMSGRAPERILKKHLRVQTDCVIPEEDWSPISCKMRDLGAAPSQKQEIQWCTARRDIHCFLRVSWPSLDVPGCLEPHLIAYINPWGPNCAIPVTDQT